MPCAVALEARKNLAKRFCWSCWGYTDAGVTHAHHGRPLAESLGPFGSIGQVPAGDRKA
jgi:hypothetical protein